MDAETYVAKNPGLFRTLNFDLKKELVGKRYMFYIYVKRCLDFIVSLIFLPLVILLIIILTPLIVIDNPGPIFYCAVRRGRNGNNFRMLKFRSMYINSPDLRNSDGSTFNSATDSRVTSVGRFLRKTSLDEIPQIINVFIGSMSFVGPRPTIGDKPFMELNEVTRKRYEVRPGITGYAQAYFRNTIKQEEKFKYDFEYVEKMSFIFDIKILIKTVISVMRFDNIFNKIEQSQ